MAALWITDYAATRSGGRVAGTFCAVTCGLWFGYAYTEPSFQTVISGDVDVVYTLLTLLIGLVVAEVGAPRRDHA
jgi:hypothetical protein